MRYKGNPITSREYRIVQLPRKNSDPIEIRVSALPIGLERIYNQLVKRPTAPIVVTGSGKDRVERANYNDPTFEERYTEYEDLRKYFGIWLAIKDSPELQFDSCAAADEMTVDKLRNFSRELQASNFTAGDIILITKASQDAGNMSDEAIKEAEKSF